MPNEQPAGALTRSNIDHFNQQAAAWDTKPHIAKLATDAALYLTNSLGLNSSTSVLDFGCGTGLLSALLAPRVAHVYGVDTSSAMVAAFNSKAADKAIANMSATCCNILDVSAVAAAQAEGLLPAAVDLVVCHMTLHHVEQVAQVLSALAALLAPQGRLVITDLLQTPDSNSFHVTNTHTVSYPGGFSQQQVREFLAPCGLTLTSWDPDALVMTRQLPVGPEGQQQDKDFAIFCATAQRTP